MKNGIKPPSITDIYEKSKMSAEEVSAFLELLKWSMEPFSKRIFISGEEMDEMSERGEFVVINELYGVRYATPRQPIEQALEKGNFPTLDWPIGRVSVMTKAFPNQLYIVYISPPSIEALQQRLAIDDRDTDGHRLRSAHEELKALESSRQSGVYDFEIISEENQVPKVAQTIYASYLQQLFPQQH